MKQVCAIILAATALSGCNEAKKPAEARQDRPVLVVEAHYQGMVQDRSLPGVVRPRIESDLGFRVSGKIARRMVDTGAVVSAGQPLAEIDDADAQLQRQSARAELDAASSNLATASNAQKRVTDLRRSGFSTSADFDRQKSAADEARSRFLKAQRALALVENTRAYSILHADAPGVVTATLIEPGQVVAAGQPAIRVARSDQKEVLVAVPETMLERARQGAASISLWSEAGKVYPAQLRELSPMADSATRTYAARFSMPTAGASVQLGMTATVTIAEITPRVMRLPLSALVDQGQGAHVFVVDPATGLLRLQAVEVESFQADAVILRSGLAEGDRVVALGTQKLDPGQKVRVIGHTGS